MSTACSTTAQLPPKRRLPPLPDQAGLERVQVLLEELRSIQQPLTTPTGFRPTIAVLLEIAEIAHVDERWQQRLKDLQEDEENELTVVGLLRFLLAEDGKEFPVGHLRVQVADDVVIKIDPISVAQWLPTAIQLIQLVHLAGIDVCEARHG